jgi:hypothetical protein
VFVGIPNADIAVSWIAVGLLFAWNPASVFLVSD